MRAKKIDAVERRLFTRIYVPLTVHFRIVDFWSKEQSSMVIEGKTWNISYDGLCIETDAAMQEGMMTFSESSGEKRVKVLPFLVMEEQQLELQVDLPSGREKVIASGRVVWSEVKSTDKIYHVKIGVFLEEMAPGEREKWNHFIQHVK
ncbi:MAG: PilZ domain-containing protein [Deltaproteobacteria bacterium]|nr:PilZ domain-containing protein [Deltaproteobacteria bacterium]